MAQTDARLRASKKYHSKLDTIVTRVPKGEKEAIQQHASAKGESLNTFVRRAIAEAIQRDNEQHI